MEYPYFSVHLGSWKWLPLSKPCITGKQDRFRNPPNFSWLMKKTALLSHILLSEPPPFFLNDSYKTQRWLSLLPVSIKPWIIFLFFKIVLINKTPPYCNNLHMIISSIWGKFCLLYSHLSLILIFFGTPYHVINVHHLPLHRLVFLQGGSLFYLFGFNIYIFVVCIFTCPLLQ